MLAVDLVVASSSGRLLARRRVRVVLRCLAFSSAGGAGGPTAVWGLLARLE